MCVCVRVRTVSLLLIAGGMRGGRFLSRGLGVPVTVWKEAKGIVCRATLRLKRDVCVVAVRVHPQAFCVVRGAEGQVWAVARGSCVVRVLSWCCAQVYDVTCVA